MVEQKIVDVKCYRCNPETGEKPHYQIYKVRVEPLMTVLNVLDYIYEKSDSTVSYYACCRRGLCGRCTLMVNGEAGLACLIIVDGDITIDPLPNRKVIKDLVVADL